MYMHSNLNKSLFNLNSLYKLISKYNEVDLFSKNGTYSSIKLKHSAWPNANYNFIENIFDTDAHINKFATEITSNNLPLLSLTHHQFCDEESLKKNGFYIIDKWVCMDLDIENTVIDIVNDDNISIVQEEEIDKYLSCAETVLFGNKKLNKGLFSFLLNNKVKLFAIMQNGIAISTTLTFIDENNVAGIYMVSSLKEYQGKGLGKRLMSFTLQQIKNKNVKQVTLQSTRAGVKLYTKLGFTQNQPINLIYKLK